MTSVVEELIWYVTGDAPGWGEDDGMTITVAAAAAAANPATPMIALPRRPPRQWFAAFRLAGALGCRRAAFRCGLASAVAASRAARAFTRPSG